MELDTIVLKAYLIYLVFPFYLGSRITTKILVQQRSGTNATSVGIIFNLMFYIVASILWLLLCFSANIGLTAETFLGGIAVTIIAFVMSILIILATLMFRRAKLDK
jgi:hypothetical protein